MVPDSLQFPWPRQTQIGKEHETARRGAAVLFFDLQTIVSNQNQYITEQNYVSNL